MIGRASRYRALTAAATAAATGLTVVLMAPSAATAAPDDSSRSVVVVLKDQLPGAPAGKSHATQRANAANQAQKSVLGKLRGKAPARVQHYHLGNAFSATVTQDQVSALAADPAVAAVVPNVSVRLTSPTAPAGSAFTVPATTGTCPADPSKPLLEPEGLGLVRAASSTGAPSAADLATGAGVKVAVLADGVDPNVPDFKRADGTSIITDQQDFTGLNPPFAEGEASGDISTIAAQGVAHDLHEVVPALPVGCNVRIVGVAPGADIVALSGLSVFATLSGLLQGIDYAANTAHVDVLNESFGLNNIPDAGARGAIQLFNDQAVAAGVTVVAASGDAGVTGTIGTPATDPQIVSVGATTSLRAVAQQGRTGTNGTWANDNIAEFSSSGFAQAGNTISLVAPGFEGWMAIAGATGGIEPFGGTSESAPYVAGAAALVIQAYRRTHGGSSPTPALVKSLLTSTSTDLGANAQDQGTGLLDARGAVEAALTYPGATGSVPAGVQSHLATSTSQLNFTGAPGSTKQGTVTVTNVGNQPLTVAPSMRRFASSGTSTTQVTPAGTAATKVPLQVSTTGGCDQLQVRVSNPAIGPGKSIELLDPSGTLMNLSAPQGASGYALLTSQPCPNGRWSLVLPTGLAGKTTIKVDTFRNTPYGQVGPGPFTLAPGAKKTVTVKLPVPADSGDTGYSLVLASSNGHTTTVPVTVRSVLSLASGAASFSGVFTGGNGRNGGVTTPSGTFTYALDVPAGQPALGVTTELKVPTGDVPDLIQGALVDPNGDVASLDVGGSGGLIEPPNVTQGINLTAVNPMKGRWLVVIQQLAAAQSIAQPFTGSISTASAVKVAATGLPNAKKTVLKAGQPTDVTVSVNNTSPSRLAILADPRTTKFEQFQLVPTSAGQQPVSPNVTVPSLLFPTPAFGVPLGTKSLTMTSSSATPTLMGMGSPSGGTYRVGNLQQAQGGSTVSTVTESLSTPTLSPGVWSSDVNIIGPTQPGVTQVPATLTASATTLGFDRTMTLAAGDTSGVGTDPYLSFVDATAPVTWTGGALLDPGKSVTFHLTIVPTGKKGDVVAGTLNVVTDGGQTNLAALAYTYKIG